MDVGAMHKLELQSPGTSSQTPLFSRTKLMVAILPFSPLKIITIKVNWSL